jgi:hypothetical protein
MHVPFFSFQRNEYALVAVLKNGVFFTSENDGTISIMLIIAEAEQ